jgi:hypothetical protein
MIEEFESETDYASILGRSALVGGTAYAGWKTYGELKSNKNINTNSTQSRRNFTRLKSRGIQAVAEPKPLSTSGRLNGIRELRKDKALRFTELHNLDVLDKTGFKSPGLLKQEIIALREDMVQKGFHGIKIHQKSINGMPGEIRVQGSFTKGGKTSRLTFPVNVIQNDASVYMGDNFQSKFTARGILDKSSISANMTGSKLKVIDSDVALIRRHREMLASYMGGIANPRDQFKQLQSSMLFEEGRSATSGGLNNSLSLIRRQQVVVDPFAEMSLAGLSGTMKQLTRVEGWGGGSASAFAAGILNSPESLVNLMPGGEVSSAANQLFRPGQFDASVKPSIDWFDGVQSGAGEFSYAHMKNQDSIRKAAEHLGYGVGEIAPEELLMNKKRNFNVKNQIYNSKINLDTEYTEGVDTLMRKVQTKLGLSELELREGLATPGGLAEYRPDLREKLNFDIFGDEKEFTKLTRKKKGLLSQLEEMQATDLELTQYHHLVDSSDVRNKLWYEAQQLDKRRLGAASQIVETDRRLAELAAQGVSEDMVRTLNLPSKKAVNKIANMSVDANNNLTIATETHHRFGVGSKAFGGQKSVVKAEVDLPRLLATADYYDKYGKMPSDKSGSVKKGMKLYEDVDFAGFEAPVKIVDGAIEPRRVPIAISNYAASLVSGKDPDKLKKLAAIGAEMGEDGQWRVKGSDYRARLQTIEDMEGGLENALAGTQRAEGSGTSVTRTLLSSDVHASQAGIGKTGSITDRGLYYLDSFGLGKSVDEIADRSIRYADSFKQLDIIDTASVGQKAVSPKNIQDAMPDLFNPNLTARRTAIDAAGGKNGTLMVNLGEEIGGLDSVPIYSQPEMSPHIGTQIGTEGGATELDRSTKDLINISQDTTATMEAKTAVAERYKESLRISQEAIVEGMTKAKVKGSMYGEVVSSIPGLDEEGARLAKQMGLPEFITKNGVKSRNVAPIAAMTEADILNKFGEAGLERAKNGDLFGYLTREPLEGSHSIVPTKFVTAESLMGAKLDPSLGNMSGRIFLGNSEMLRSGQMVDFDKDTESAIAVLGDDATNQLKNFMGLNGKQSEMGREYYRSLERMIHLTPKGRKAPVNALETLDQDMFRILGAQKDLEKSKIGTFSNEFKKVHTGLREQLAQNAGTDGAASAYYKGEDFAHTFVENILKAKHQSKESLLKNEASEALDVIAGKGKYADATEDARALRLQGIYDQLSYSTVAEAQAARQAGTATGVDAIAESMGLSGEAGMSANRAYAEVSSTDNIKNVLRAHKQGAEILKKGDYMSQVASMRSQTKVGRLLEKGSFIVEELMSKGTRNLAKYAIAPAAVIGFASSLMSSPNTLQKGAIHHSATDPSPEPDEVNMGKTIFAIPESKVDNIQIKGRANARTDLTGIQNAGRSSGGYSSSMTDMRSKPDKHRIQELIDKGY